VRKCKFRAIFADPIVVHRSNPKDGMLEKKMSAFVPNVIQITNRAAKYLMKSSLARDTADGVIYLSRALSGG
jgi:hypothetical protein